MTLFHFSFFFFWVGVGFEGFGLWFARVSFVWVCLRGCVVFKVLPMGWLEWTCFSLRCSITSTWSLLVVPYSLVSCKSSFHFCLLFDLLAFQTCVLTFRLFRCLKPWVFLWFSVILIYSFIYPYFFGSLGLDILFPCTYAVSALNRVFYFSCFAISRFEELHLLVWLYFGDNVSAWNFLVLNWSRFGCLKWKLLWNHFQFWMLESVSCCFSLFIPKFKNNF